MQMQSGTSASCNGRSTLNAVARTLLLHPPRAFSSKSDTSYEAALAYARAQQYKASRVAFERVLTREPQNTKAWTSYAMMEKRCAGANAAERYARCRMILQRGLALNPQSTRLLQAFGLMELQRGNWLAALILLERCVSLDPRLEPVLNWTQVHIARKTVGSRRGKRAGEASASASAAVAAAAVAVASAAMQAAEDAVNMS